ncbi:MAG: hypothetical protein CM1200mP10_06760 [Candidatus Neomarinimicrobiota bacterium]|nr:MAG: hypothetical protein CM1200mP10_06760 [Candidatus Neomarinimicrobiota bacterium]
MSVYLFSLIGIGLAGRLPARKTHWLIFTLLEGDGCICAVSHIVRYTIQWQHHDRLCRESVSGGYQSLVMVIFMSSVIGAYFIYAPKLFRLPTEDGFITTGDFIHIGSKIMP